MQPMKQARREDAAGAAGAEGHCGGEELEE